MTWTGMGGLGFLVGSGVGRVVEVLLGGGIVVGVVAGIVGLEGGGGGGAVVGTDLVDSLGHGCG